MSFIRSLVLMDQADVEIVDNIGEEEEIPYRYSITSYGADYVVDGLVRRLGDGSIYVPKFQRGYVWSLTQASKFVESLLLGLPVPGIFLCREEDTQKLLVIDGQQRLRTLEFFYKGIFSPLGREFSLRGVQSRLSGATYESLKNEDKRLLDDAILHATIIKQDEPSDDNSSIYHIFERLNTGGTQLLPQEIRACIFHGEFDELLKKLNNNKTWRTIYGPTNLRMRDQELVLRFLALHFNGKNYKEPMKGFLNDYMGKNKHLKLQSMEDIAEAFEPTVEVIFKSLGNNAFKPKGPLNAAVFDAVMVGVASRLQKGQITQYQDLKKQYSTLISNGEFVTATESTTASVENVRKRLALATNAFAEVK